MLFGSIVDLWASNNEWILLAWGEIKADWVGFVLQAVVLIVAFYLVLCNLHGRSVWAIFKIVLVFLLVDCLVRYFHLQAIEVMLKSLWMMIGFVSVVVFQPEIRHIIDKISVYGANVSLSKETIDAVVRAVVDMGKTKTGAIIVLERKIGIDGYIDSSDSTERLNANVSWKLLENIFIKDTPLHDMAVVIRENKILAARVLLPLSFHTLNDGIGRTDFGTRHAAGLGISERSDAIAVVVSEERGGITIFIDGRRRLLLSLPFDENDVKRLREKLYEYAGLNTTGKISWIRNTFDWGRKTFEKITNIRKGRGGANE